jgi:hypothetical protein
MYVFLCHARPTSRFTRRQKLIQRLHDVTMTASSSRIVIARCEKTGEEDSVRRETVSFGAKPNMHSLHRLFLAKQTNKIVDRILLTHIGSESSD